MTNFCKTLFNEEVQELSCDGGRLIFKQYGDFIFVLHAQSSSSTQILGSILNDIGGLCRFLFGPCQEWDAETFALDGAQDVLNYLFVNATQDLSVVAGGVNQIFLGNSTAERVDKLLTFLESQDGIVGNSSVMILGNSVFHSRTNLQNTRRVLHYHKARPMPSSVNVRFTPVYANNSWRSLFTFRIGSYTVSMLAALDQAFEAIQSRFEEFRQSFLQSRLEIPIEEPPVLLRLFAKREALCLFYHNVKTGHTISPQLRYCSEIQHQEITGVFWSCFCEASRFLAVPGIKEFSLIKDQYRFYARSESIHRIYLLLANDSISAESVPAISNEVLRNLKAYVGA